ncbi:MAG: hypothetical protein JWO18_19 [Microbacteriaceae bacterium]|nr:hypothetical protein [Microbacteriaceae bacterium]
MLEAELLRSFPEDVDVPVEAVSMSNARAPRTLIVLDDDPTGTQSVSDVPVLTRWEPDDIRWALELGRGAVYVLTNTRSLDPAAAAARNREVVTNALVAADGAPLGFVSRSDSTLRGHYPLEPDTIADVLEEQTGVSIDGIVIVPAFPDAGRVTIGGVHYVRVGSTGELVPISETEFARDASFGYASSSLADYVQEKSNGRSLAESVVVLDLGVIRSGAASIADALASVAARTPIVVDIVTENDLRGLALGLAESERRGKHFVYRVGPPFVRARIGQAERAPLTASEIVMAAPPSQAGGLIVVGSHVGLTSRQLAQLLDHDTSATVVELDVRLLMDEGSRKRVIDAAVTRVVEGLDAGDVVLHTSRELVKSDDPAESLRIARVVSAALVSAVRRVLGAHALRFVIAKGGITSSDVASDGLSIRRAMVLGPLLPGIVSLWQPAEGPAMGIPYVVFAGNVGDDRSLWDVVNVLSFPRVLG